jgi:Bifunctional DNA primase/polymerase, N-terminal/Primase C terminal 2 (PriCT-2)
MKRRRAATVLDAALEYAARGWAVFPVPPGLKCGYSVEKRGFDNGAPWGKTTDETEVREYWRRLPRANIGLVMGAGSNIFDIETDTKAGHANLKQDGAESLAELEAKHKLPATLMFESPSGSVHRLFAYPGGNVRVRTGPLDAVNYPGIDCKGDGGMSIAPPSRTRKGVYKWINKRRIAAAPAWLLALVCSRAPAAREPNIWEQFASSTKQASIAELTLAMAMIPNGIAVGRELWVTVGLALWSATGGSEEGYQLFAAWSRRWPGYNEKKTRTFWDTIKTTPRNIAAGTIFFLAEQAVPEWKSRIISRDPTVIRLLEEFHKLLGEP